MPRYAAKRSSAEEATTSARPLKRSREQEDSEDESSGDERPTRASSGKDLVCDEAEEASGPEDVSGSEEEDDDEPETEPDSDSGSDSDEDGSRYSSLKEEEQIALDARRIAHLRARRNYF